MIDRCYHKMKTRFDRTLALMIFGLRLIHKQTELGRHGLQQATLYIRSNSSLEENIISIGQKRDVVTFDLYPHEVLMYYLFEHKIENMGGQTRDDVKALRKLQFQLKLQIQSLMRLTKKKLMLPILPAAGEV